MGRERKAISTIRWWVAKGPSSRVFKEVLYPVMAIKKRIKNSHPYFLHPEDFVWIEMNSFLEPAIKE